MESPKIAGNKPVAVKLEENKNYAWCACGKSSKQPFCDGSHKGTSFSPHIFKSEKSETKQMCMCKHTKNKPFCDGTHSKL